MNRRRPYIEQRRPIYIGCEGASEVGYVGFLAALVRDAELPVHLIADELGRGAGDPLSRIELALGRLKKRSQSRATPRHRFVLLDSDQAVRNPQRASEAGRLADRHDIQIVWQHPCFEAVLLRHLDGRAAHRPSDSPGAEKALLKEWPEYSKPMAGVALTRRIDLAAVQRAAAVEPELKIMLACIGLL